jgi:hypothetical protein
MTAKIPWDGHGSDRCPGILVWVVHLSIGQDLGIKLAANNKDSAVENSDAG